MDTRLDCVPVRVSTQTWRLCAYFRATGNEADGERYQRLQCYKRSKTNGNFPETAAFQLEKLAV